MPVLIYQDSKGNRLEQPFSEDPLHIGSDRKRNDLVLPAESGVAPMHAVIVKSALNRLHVLVNLAGQHTRVNGRQVVYIQVLHQRDELQLGQVQLTMWEVRITSVQRGDRFVGSECLVCTKPFEMGQAVIICPRCSVPHHRGCWFYYPICANDTCQYPSRQRVIDALSPWVKFERYLADDSELARARKGGTTCQARQPGDQVPFKPEDQIAYCPNCDRSYHLTCWLQLERCPYCDFEFKNLVDRIFSVGYGSLPRTGEPYVR